MNRRARRAGFTLVELLVVLAIAGLLMAVGPPLIAAAFPGVELKAAARRAAGALRVARELAVADGRDVAWQLDTESGRHGIEGRARAGRLPAGIELRLVGAESEMRDAAIGGIRFYPDGSSSGGRVLLGRGGRGYQVGVNWLTGRILIADWTPE